MRIGLPLALIGLACVLLWQEVEPVPTWFYVFAWYPTLALFDGLTTKLDGRRSLLGRPRTVASLLGWSAVIWLVFEAANFRLENWYYVFLPRERAERWVGILVSFATVVPAVVLAERALDAAGLGRRWRPRPLSLGFADVRWFSAWGAAATLAVMIWPRYLYPLIWGTLLLGCDPLVYRRRRAWSLLSDIERGEWGRIARLMVGGLGIGFIWETYNHWARGKWIYTVPLLEDVKWFEMPPLGFVGFPFFAIEAWAMYHALVVMGAALPTDEHGRAQSSTVELVRARPRWSVLVAAPLAVAFTVAVLAGMERWTISSTVPARATWELAATEAARLAEESVPIDSAVRQVELARLATLRGIGVEHASILDRLGVSGVCELARQEAGALWRRVHTARPEPGRRPTEPEVRQWVRAAQRRCPLEAT